MSVTAVTTSAALLLVGQLQAQQVVNASSEAPAVGQVLALREQLGTAALAGDVALLKELLSSELVVSDPDNNIRRRDDLLSLFDKGEVAYRSIETTIDFADQLGDLVVIMGTQSTVLETAPQGSRWGPGTTLLRRFTDVFRNEDGSWRLIIRQSTVFATE
jgi:hypothetical protein